MTDIATDMDALKTIKNLKKKSIESLLTLLFMERAKLIKLRDTHMIFSAHIQIKALDKIINGKCFS